MARTEERGDPTVGELTGQAQSAGGERRQIDWHCLAHRPGQELEALVEPEDLTLEDQAIAPKHLADDGDGFPHAHEWSIERHAVPAAHHLVATRPEPEDEPPAGDQMERRRRLRQESGRDRKSTRLNSSHRTISYAVFCLKKKTQNNKDTKQ